MQLLNAPKGVDYFSETAVVDHFKSYINLINAQFKLHAKRPYAHYFTDNGYAILTYEEVDRISTNLALKLADKVQNVQVVSYIDDHTIDYLFVVLAIMKLRTSIFCISPRNATASVAHLIEKTESKLVITSEKYEKMTREATSESSGMDVIVTKKLNIKELLSQPLDKENVHKINLEFNNDDIEKTALIIHSSGTTGLPKPIYLSNRAVMNHPKFMHVRFNGECDSQSLDSNDVLFACLPMYHVFGYMTILGITTIGGSAVFMEKLPPTQNELFKALKDNKVSFFVSSPITIEQMAAFLSESGDFSALEHLKYINYGGADLKKEVRDWIYNKGIKLASSYGSTEMGNIMATSAEMRRLNRVSVCPNFEDAEGNSYGCFEVDDPNEPDVLHFYVRAGCPSLASIKSNREDGGFSSNDLFREDPECPGNYTYVGRRDDTLVMNNGEKTNPVPMEATLRQSLIIKQALIVAKGRDCTAALIELDLETAFNYSPDEMIASVQEAVKAVNKECPNYSTIFPQMVKILPFNQSLPATDKGTIKRKIAEKTFSDMIEKLYRDFLESPKDEKNKDANTWSREQLKDFLVKSIAEVLGIAPSDLTDMDESIFNYGLNSLTAIQLRNKISEYFENVSQTFLYQNSTINAMIDSLSNNAEEDIEEQLEMRVQQTHEIAESYIKKAETDFAKITVNNYGSSNKVVLLTGVTGALGSHMLQCLLQDPSVTKVYCCVRGKESERFQRLVDTFKSRSLNVSLLYKSHVEVLPLAFDQPFLGFTEDVYNRLKSEVTIIQHCAWMLDFNKMVKDYDVECIQPFYNLLKFAYRAENPMHVHFISSISGSAHYAKTIPEDFVPFDAHHAMSMGYAQSKLIVEALFEYLVEEKNLPCYIHRVGQLCGDSEHGIWNTSEQYPLMFMGGAATMQKMPAMDTVLDWLPVDYAARTISDIMVQTAYLPASRDQAVYNIVNPRLITWDELLKAMREAGMVFDTLPANEWVETLAKDDKNPAYKLMGFFETNIKNSVDMSVWETKKVTSAAPVLKEAPAINGELFKKFLNHWEKIGFYSPPLKKKFPENYDTKNSKMKYASS